jgi:hypothetical protein
MVGCGYCYLLHLSLGDKGLGDALEAVIEDLGDGRCHGLGLLGGHALRLQLLNLRSPFVANSLRQAFQRTPLGHRSTRTGGEAAFVGTARRRDVPGRGCRRGRHGSRWS